jgi:DNA-binding transcriptional ArsR family regulator
MGHVKRRDFTRTPSPAIVQVALHGAADLLLALWLLDGCEDEEASRQTDTYELGTAWFDDLREHLTDATRDLIARVGSGEVWIAILSMLPEESDNGTVDSFVDFLSSYDPVELRFRLLMLHDIVPDEAREQAADAAEGDAEALEAVLALPGFDEHTRLQATVRYIFGLTPVETRDLIADTLTAVQADIFSKYESQYRPALERDITARRSMARRLSPERLVEVTTNGISIEDSGYVRPIVLMPSIVGRPWVVFTESREHLVMCYQVADEYIDADPDTPPQWVVKTYKALGDERRLRLLRRLAKGPASLAELVDEMGGSKSTLHHHLMLLRTAGLVRITLGTEKEYSLRADVFPETAAVLQAYIHAGGATE